MADLGRVKAQRNGLRAANAIQQETIAGYKTERDKLAAEGERLTWALGKAADDCQEIHGLLVDLPDDTYRLPQITSIITDLNDVEATARAALDGAEQAGPADGRVAELVASMQRILTATDRDWIRKEASSAIAKHEATE